MLPGACKTFACLGWQIRQSSAGNKANVLDGIHALNMGIREHFCPKHLLSKTCKRKVNTDWLVCLPPPTLIAWPEWLRFWVSDVCCQTQKYWRLSQKRLNVHVNKDSSSSLYAEDILLFLKLELIRSIFTGVKKKEGTITRKCLTH